MGKKKVVVLGSTGSIGQSTLKVLRHLPEQFELVGLAAGSRWQEAAEQAAEFSCKYASIQVEASYSDFKKAVPSGCEALLGQEGLIKMVTDSEVDFVLCAIVGTDGLLPVLEAIRCGKTIGLASKEILVMAGELVMSEAKKYGVDIIPVDSEHNAIFQCLQGDDSKDIRRLLVTCSGGPFLRTPKEDFPNVTLEKALKHPTWDMGPKITIDSATLMNKSLEVIEAKYLFDVDIRNVEAVIHPQSIVHSMVEFVDGSILAQLSEPDMVFPIQYALTFPKRYPGSLKPLDFSQGLDLRFESPDHERFPSLKMAEEAVLRGGTTPAIFNAANEVAVDAFVKGQIHFVQIWDVIRAALEQHQTISNPSLEQIIAADQAIRQFCRESIVRGL